MMRKKIFTVLFLTVALFNISMGMEKENKDLKEIGSNPAVSTIPVFTYVTEGESGISLNNNFKYHGIALGDVNGDNYDDITVSNMQGPHAYYLNNGNGIFTDVSSNLPDYNYDGHGIVLFDSDNDGDLDLVIANAGSESVGYGLNQFFLNDGNGSFTEMTDRLSGRRDGTRGVVAFDFDNSGSLDLYFVNHQVENELFSNQGNGTFTEVAASWNCQDTSPPKDGSQGVTTVDYDNDGLMDIYITRTFYTIPDQRNVFYRNQGDSFVNVAPSLGLDLDDNNGSTFSDLNNDGWLDLFTCSNGNNNVLRVFRNIEGSFTEITDITNIETGSASGFSAIAADLNNDGFEDIIVPGRYATSRIYFNTGNFQFTELTTGIEQYLGDSRSVAVFDYDNDGDMDIVITGKRATGVRLYENLLNPHQRNDSNYVQLVVMNPNGGYGAFGTKLYLYSNNFLSGSPFKYRQIKSTEAYLSQSSPVNHFGLGTRLNTSFRVEFLTGEEKFLYDIDANSKYYIGFLPDIAINNVQEIQEESFLFVGPRYLDFNFDAITEIDSLKIFVRMNGIWSLLEERQITDSSLSSLMLEADDSVGEYGFQYSYSNNGKNYISYVTFYSP